MISARLFAGLLTAAALLGCTTLRAQVIDHSNPASNNDDLIANQNYDWGPVFLGGLCRLTDKGTSETGSVFSRDRVNVAEFRTSFVFQILSGSPGDASTGEGNIADGITFTLQNQGPDALGAAGGSLGYAGIGHSVAVKFDVVRNGWPGGDDPSFSSTGLYANGESPRKGIDLLKDGVNLRSQHPFRADMYYNGRILTVQVTDLATSDSSTQKYTVDIPRLIGSPVAFVGFTAATGLGSASQDIKKWYFSSPPLRQVGQVTRRSPERIALRPALRSAARLTVAAWPTANWQSRKANLAGIHRRAGAIATR